MTVERDCAAAGLWPGGSAIAAAPPRLAQTPKRGGTLTYMIPADAPPSFDGHRETTFATVHADGAVLQRADPRQPGQPGLDHRFRLRSLHRDAEADRRRQDLHLQDPRRREVPRRLAADRRRRGGELEPHRLPAARASPARAQSYYVDGRQDRGARRRRPWSSSSSSPTDGVPAGARRSLHLDLQEGDPREGPALVREEHHGLRARSSSSAYEIGQSIKGVRNPDYYHKGLPYLDGFDGIFADKQAVRVDAIRADRAAIEFRGLPPSARDELVKELGDKVTVQDSDWNCGNLDHAQPQEEAVRRRAGAPRADAGDRPVGAARRRCPRSPTCARWAASSSPARRWPPPRRSCRRSPASGPTSRSRAPRRRRLLKEAGAEGLKFELLNRNVDQPYKYVGTWADRRVEARSASRSTQKVVPTGPWFEAMRSGNFDVVVEANCQSVVNPLLDTGKYLPQLGLSGELRRLRGPEVDRALREDAARDRSRPSSASPMRAYEKHTLDTQAHEIVHAVVVPHHPGRGPT